MIDKEDPIILKPLKESFTCSVCGNKEDKTYYQEHEESPVFCQKCWETLPTMDIEERLRSDADNIGHNNREIYPVGSLLDAADEIKRLKKELETKAAETTKMLEAAPRQLKLMESRAKIAEGNLHKQTMQIQGKAMLVEQLQGENRLLRTRVEALREIITLLKDEKNLNSAVTRLDSLLNPVKTKKVECSKCGEAKSGNYYMVNKDSPPFCEDCWKVLTTKDEKKND